MPRELLLLRAILDAAESIRDLIGTRTAGEIGADEIRRAALLWHFTVLGESANLVPSEVKEQHADVAWRAATRMRNRIVHGYWSIDLEVLVATALDDLPQMIAGLDEAIGGRN